MNSDLEHRVAELESARPGLSPSPLMTGGCVMSPVAAEAPLMTVPQVAELLSISPWTVRRYVLQKRLVSRRLPGGDFRFRREDVEAMLDAG